MRLPKWMEKIVLWAAIACIPVQVAIIIIARWQYPLAHNPETWGYCVQAGVLDQVLHPEDGVKGSPCPMDPAFTNWEVSHVSN